MCGITCCVNLYSNVHKDQELLIKISSVTSALIQELRPNCLKNSAF